MCTVRMGCPIAGSDRESPERVKPCHASWVGASSCEIFDGNMQQTTPAQQLFHTHLWASVGTVSTHFIYHTITKNVFSIGSKHACPLYNSIHDMYYMYVLWPLLFLNPRKMASTCLFLSRNNVRHDNHDPGVLFPRFCPSFRCVQTFEEKTLVLVFEISNWGWMNLVKHPNMQFCNFCCSAGTPRGLSCSLSQ